MKQNIERAIEEVRGMFGAHPGDSLEDALYESRREEKEHEDRKDRERSPAKHAE